VNQRTSQALRALRADDDEPVPSPPAAAPDASAAPPEPIGSPAAATPEPIASPPAAASEPAASASAAVSEPVASASAAALASGKDNAIDDDPPRSRARASEPFPPHSEHPTVPRRKPVRLGGPILAVLLLLTAGVWGLSRWSEPSVAPERAPALPTAIPDPPRGELLVDVDPPLRGAASLEGPGDVDSSGSGPDPLEDDPPGPGEEVIEIPEDPEEIEAGAQSPDTDSSEASTTREPRAPVDRPRTVPDIEPDPPPPGVVAVDGLLTPTEPGPRGDHDAARHHCESLAVARYAGVSRWRLANPTQAKQFRGASAVKRGRYWTTARWKGRARVIELPSAKTASKRIEGKFRPFCVARWP
jgi:hypothetical protein